MPLFTRDRGLDFGGRLKLRASVFVPSAGVAIQQTTDVERGEAASRAILFDDAAQRSESSVRWVHFA